MNNLAAAERGLNQEENDRKNFENIEGPNKKWVFVKFFKVETKVVLDRQPLLGTWPLSAWQRNLRVGVCQKWFHWTLSMTKCFSGVALLFPAGHAPIGAQRLQES